MFQDYLALDEPQKLYRDIVFYDIRLELVLAWIKYYEERLDDSGQDPTQLYGVVKDYEPVSHKLSLWRMIRDSDNDVDRKKLTYLNAVEKAKLIFRDLLNVERFAIHFDDVRNTLIENTAPRGIPGRSVT